MIIIIANLNAAIELRGFQADKIMEACTSMGLDQPIYIQTPEELPAILEQNRYQSCLLFSNYPPDCSYADVTLAPNYNTNRGWDADSYEKSANFFKDLFTNYSFKAIHFITNAPFYMTPEFLLKELSPRAKVSVTRKRELADFGLGYEHNRRIFIVEKIEEAMLF
jgi:hypothetical protein